VGKKEKLLGDYEAELKYCIFPKKVLHMLKRKSIVLFGDSLTQYGFKQGAWGLLLVDYVTPSFDVICRGFSGYTTRSAVPLLPIVFNALPPPSIVTVFWGANDSSKGRYYFAFTRFDVFRQHIPLLEFEANLNKLVEFFNNSDNFTSKPTLIFITPPPVDAVARNSGTFWSFCTEYIF
jgi:lysophospholipase L1-like esterase